MKTIKIIDLLIKISNGEEIPKKIKYNNQIWCWNAQTKEYIATCTICEYRLIPEIGQLNDEVEILEEENNIPAKMPHYYTSTDNDTAEFLLKCINVLADKYNELLDYLESKEKGE